MAKKPLDGGTGGGSLSRPLGMKPMGPASRPRPPAKVGPPKKMLPMKRGK